MILSLSLTSPSRGGLVLGGFHSKPTFPLSLSLSHYIQWMCVIVDTLGKVSDLLIFYFIVIELN